MLTKEQRAEMRREQESGICTGSSRACGAPGTARSTWCQGCRDYESIKSLLDALDEAERERDEARALLAEAVQRLTPLVDALQRGAIVYK